MEIQQPGVVIAHAAASAPCCCDGSWDEGGFEERLAGSDVTRTRTLGHEINISHARLCSA